MRRIGRLLWYRDRRGETRGSAGDQATIEQAFSLTLALPPPSGGGAPASPTATTGSLFTFTCGASGGAGGPAGGPAGAAASAAPRGGRASSPGSMDDLVLSTVTQLPAAVAERFSAAGATARFSAAGAAAAGGAVRGTAAASGAGDVGVAAAATAAGGGGRPPTGRVPIWWQGRALDEVQRQRSLAEAPARH